MTIPDKLPPLVDQVCTPEQSRELWELGVRLEGLYEWNVYESGEEITLKDRVMYSNFGEPVRTAEYVGTYQAYTSAELGIMLARFIGAYVNGKRVTTADFPRFDPWGEGRPWYQVKKIDYSPAMGGFPNEAQARAGMLIRLLKGGNDAE